MTQLALDRPLVVPPRRPRRIALWSLLGLGGIGLLAQAVLATHLGLGELIGGFSGMYRFVRHALPPDLSVIQTGLSATVQTFDIALLGTVGAMVFSVPLAVCAAENLSPARPIYLGTRGLIAVCRAVPDLIWALIFVTAVGLGPYPGVLALTVHSVGMLGRLFADEFEDMDMGPVQALTTMGATRPQVFGHAVLPGTIPGIVGIGLYRFDENVRSSLVLGFVGAGGIGFQIYTSMELFQFRRTTTYILMTLVLVWVLERVSATIRRRVQ